MKLIERALIKNILTINKFLDNLCNRVRIGYQEIPNPNEI